MSDTDGESAFDGRSFAVIRIYATKRASRVSMARIQRGPWSDGLSNRGGLYELFD